MTETFCQTAELAGMEFDFTGEVEFHYEDNSFSHEFGIERCGQYEVDQIDWADFDCDERAICADYLRDERRDGRKLSRKRFRKVLRQRVNMVHAALANADLDNLFDMSELDDMANEAGNNYDNEPEPNYD